MGEVGLLRVAQIVQERPGGRHGRGVSIEAESFEAVRAELIEERPARRLVLERPRLDARDRQPVARAIDEHMSQVEPNWRDDFAGPQHRHLVGQGLQAGLTGIFGAGEFARGQIQ